MATPNSTNGKSILPFAVHPETPGACSHATAPPCPGHAPPQLGSVPPRPSLALGPVSGVVVLNLVGMLAVWFRIHLESSLFLFVARPTLKAVLVKREDRQDNAVL